MKINLIYYGICLVSILILACDHGLAPSDVQKKGGASGISGTITYQNWPPAASIKNLKIIIFIEFPPDNIFQEVQSGRAIVFPADFSESLPQFVDSFEYSFMVDPGTYEYVVVAQQFGGLFDWRAVGQYDTTPEDSLPTAITVTPNSILSDVNINVDFNRLPIQPF
jgi:hypothetical protein